MALPRKALLGLGRAVVVGVAVDLVLRLFPAVGESGAAGAGLAVASLVALGGAGGDRRVALGAVAGLALAPLVAFPALAMVGWLAACTVVALVAAAVAAATVLRDRLPAPVAGVLGDAPARNALLALALGLYVAFREDLAGAVSHVEVWEWALGILVFAYLASRAKTALRAGMAPSAWASPAKRHVPDVAPRLDAAYETWARASKGFVEDGTNRAEYETLWRGAFGTVARRSETIDKALEPLAALQPAPRPVLPLPWRMRRVEEEDRRRRLQVHRTLVARLRAARKVPRVRR